MKYLCLCYYDTDAFARLTPADGAALGAACQPHDVALKATGKLVAQGSLALPEAWSNFVPRDGKPLLQIGPYLNGPHQAGAFFIIDAETMDDAQETASKHAAANVGEGLGFAVEVRACEMYEPFAAWSDRRY